jgi:hypothetical protein
MIQWMMIHPWLALSIALSLIGVFCLLPIKKMRQALKTYWQSFKTKLGY